LKEGNQNDLGNPTRNEGPLRRGGKNVGEAVTTPPYGVNGGYEGEKGHQAGKTKNGRGRGNKFKTCATKRPRQGKKADPEAGKRPSYAGRGGLLTQWFVC